MPWFGWGGWGRGWRWWWRITGLPGWMRWGYPSWHPPYFPDPAYRLSKEEEIEYLEEMKRELEAELEEIKKRIEELKKT